MFYVTALESSDLFPVLSESLISARDAGTGRSIPVQMTNQPARLRRINWPSEEIFLQNSILGHVLCVFNHMIQSLILHVCWDVILSLRLVD